MDYSKVTADEFAEAVRTVARRLGTNSVLDITGVWEVVSEALNNEALDICPSAIYDENPPNAEHEPRAVASRAPCACSASGCAK